MLRILTAASLAAALIATLVLTSVTGQEEQPGMQATPEGTPGALFMGAAYLTIANDGETADRLVRAETEIALDVEIHEVVDDDGMMRMRPLTDGLEIPPGETVVLRPGSYHLMLIGLTTQMTPGTTYELVLTFEHAGEIVVDVHVVEMGRARPAATPIAPIREGDISVAAGWSRPAPMMADDTLGTPGAHRHGMMHDSTPGPMHQGQ